MKVNIRSNIKKELPKLKRLKKISKEDVIRITLLETSKDAKRFAVLGMRKHLNRPTPRTLNSIRLIYPTRKLLRAVVTFKDWAMEYMQWPILGGMRRVIRTGIPRPDAKLNQYGNIPGRQKGLLNEKNTFIATIQGHEGVWQRIGKGKNKKLKLLYEFHNNPRYEQQYRFYRIVHKAVQKFLPIKFKKVSSYYLRKEGWL